WFDGPTSTCGDQDAAHAMNPMNQNTQIITVTPQTTTIYSVHVMDSQGNMVGTGHITVCVTPPSGSNFNLTVHILGAGTITSNPAGISCSTNDAGNCVAPYVSDSKVKLTAAPHNGSQIIWRGNCSP